MKTTSWVIRNKETKEVICEIYDKRKIDALNRAKYEAIPIIEHLIQFNQSLKG